LRTTLEKSCLLLAQAHGILGFVEERFIIRGGVAAAESISSPLAGTLLAVGLHHSGSRIHGAFDVVASLLGNALLGVGLTGDEWDGD